MASFRSELSMRPKVCSSDCTFWITSAVDRIGSQPESTNIGCVITAPRIQPLNRGRTILTCAGPQHRAPSQWRTAGWAARGCEKARGGGAERADLRWVKRVQVRREAEVHLNVVVAVLPSECFQVL
eukprot:COSAG01_NODE_38045_length_495_cov_0.739899_1_plen_125_part_10